MIKRGLMHLRDVPLIGRSNGLLIECLRTAIRKTADRQHGRNIPLEDRLRGALSWCELGLGQHGVFLVRISAIDPDGKVVIGSATDETYISEALLTTLYNETYQSLVKNMRFVYTKNDNPSTFAHHYTPGALDHTDFLYADDWPPKLRNIVVMA